MWGCFSRGLRALNYFEIPMFKHWLKGAKGKNVFIRCRKGKTSFGRARKKRVVCCLE